MSLFASPEEHAANPPSTWVVKKAAPRLWHLCTKEGIVLSYGHATKKEADSLMTSGFYVNLYNDETRWYAGESVRNWIPYSQLKSRATKAS